MLLSLVIQSNSAVDQRLSLAYCNQHSYCIITKTSRSDHIPPAIKELHWLPVERLLQYKIKMLLYTYKAIHSLSPSYLKDILVPYHPFTLCIDGGEGGGADLQRLLTAHQE